MFKEELIQKGYNVCTIDFVNPMRSCGYNPFDFIRRYKDGSFREQDILTLATTLIPEMDAREPF